MNIDDYDMIPCSAKEAYSEMVRGGYATSSKALLPMRIWAGKIQQYWKGAWDQGAQIITIGRLGDDWFKLAPKQPGKCEDCGTARTGKEHKWCGACYRRRMDKIIKDDRFAVLDTLIEEHFAMECWDPDIAKNRFKQITRAIVELIEKEKA